MKKYIVYTKENGKIETDNWDDVGGLTLHRENGPAIQGFYYSGKLANEAYYLNSKRHRLDGTAYQEFYPGGQLDYEEYYINGKRHRIDGPAYQRFYDTGQLYYESYYINGRFYIKSDYAVYMFNKKMQLL